MKIINVSRWDVDELDASGSREKQWLIQNSSKEKYLFKKPKSFGEIYAEYIAYLVGTTFFNLNIPEVSIAKRDEIDGVILKNFVNDEIHVFLEISDYLQQHNPEFDPMNLLHYELGQCVRIIQELDLLKEFFEMCIFDTVIANQDRHCENWGILKSKNNQVAFSPLYDNGSSLACLLTEEQVDEYLNNEKSFEKYTNRAKTIFTFNKKKRIKIKDFIIQLNKIDPILFRTTFEKFSHIDYSSLRQLIDGVEQPYMSDKRKELVAKLISYRIDCIKGWIAEGDTKSC